ncbi:hypothetical protein MNBD_CHLOROFLEXI01-2606 [hydrothermal vent metagenome]|uniref:DUF433 domain-containing protein n=1 Tax=hydrothermal vent metagenome TaxID=652676 RepID=A0A3B0V4Z4_9ZZZZ
MLAETGYEHIALNENDIPIITGTTMKVIELVLDHIAYGWSPEEMRFQHPQLSLGQIYSAMAYYWDHQDELDADIEQRLRKVDALAKSARPTPLDARLRAKGLLK